MYIAKCKIDDRGRITLPKSFMEANQLDEYTEIYIQTMYNTDNCVKLVFVDPTEECYKQYEKEQESSRKS